MSRFTCSATPRTGAEPRPASLARRLTSRTPAARQRGAAQIFDSKVSYIAAGLMFGAVVLGVSEYFKERALAEAADQVAQVSSQVKRGLMLAGYGPSGGADLSAFLINNEMVHRTMVDRNAASPVLRHSLGRNLMTVTGYPDRFEIGIEGLEPDQCTKLLSAQAQSGVVAIAVAGSDLDMTTIRETDISAACNGATAPITATLTFN